MPAVIKLGVLRLEIGDPTTIIEHSGHYTIQIRRFCRDFLDLLVKRAKLTFRKRSGVGGKAAVLGITNGYLVEGERREERVENSGELLTSSPGQKGKAPGEGAMRAGGVAACHGSEEEGATSISRAS
jgi:hypothetical protein